MVDGNPSVSSYLARLGTNFNELNLTLTSFGNRRASQANRYQAQKERKEIALIPGREQNISLFRRKDKMRVRGADNDLD